MLGRNLSVCLTNNRLDDRLGLRVFGSENARITRGVWSLWLASYEPRKDSQLGYDWLIHFPSPTHDQVFRSQLPRLGVLTPSSKIDRASCREREWQYVRISVVNYSLKQKTKNE